MDASYYLYTNRFCRNVLRNHMLECRSYATTKVENAIRFEREAVCKEEGARLRYLEGYRPDVDESLTIQERTEICASRDPALNSLKEILASAPDNEDDIIAIEMPAVENVPKYDAWVPVRTNFWVGKDMELEPYMPYFGDDNEGRCKAFDLYKDMARDANQENNLSDGEVNDRGEIVEPQNEKAWTLYESLPQVRWRAACREAIVRVLDQYDNNDEKVWEAMGNALGIKSKKRLKVVAEIALERRKKKAENDEARSHREELRSETILARTCGMDDSSIAPAGSMTKEAMRHFCFTCQIFHCRQHENRDVYPIIPIRDLEVEARERVLAKTSAPPCSSMCFLMQAAHMAPEQANESQPWTVEEIAILREVTSVFHFDPCRLATVIGTRTCRDVFEKLEEPNEKIMMKREINNSKQRRKIDSKLRSKRLADAGGRGDHDSDVEDVEVPELEKGKKGKKKAFKQLDNNKNTPAENEDFLPCYHVGDCTFDSCTCVQRNLPCESTCACTNVRFVEGANRRGVARFIDRSARMKGEYGLCQNLIYGCSCKKGHCNTDGCDCWKQNRACNPDICDDCDCNIMPSQLPSSARRCRNVSVGIARHKRTIVGKSRVHGYGLFAADYFQPGDLIGIYGGQLLDTRLADMVGRLYDAKDHTFFFDITESIVIDGGVLGMKSKFCNHTHGGTKAENCHSKLVRVRGDANIALFAKRAIVPGEELMFDYKFQSVIPPWAKQPTKSGRKEEPMPVELDNNSTRRPPTSNKRKSKSRRGIYVVFQSLRQKRGAKAVGFFAQCRTLSVLKKNQEVAGRILNLWIARWKAQLEGYNMQYVTASAPMVSKVIEKQVENNNGGELDEFGWNVISSLLQVIAKVCMNCQTESSEFVSVMLKLLGRVGLVHGDELRSHLLEFLISIEVVKVMDDATLDHLVSVLYYSCLFMNISVLRVANTLFRFALKLMAIIEAHSNQLEENEAMLAYAFAAAVGKKNQHEDELAETALRIQTRFEIKGSCL